MVTSNPVPRYVSVGLPWRCRRRPCAVVDSAGEERRPDLAQEELHAVDGVVDTDGVVGTDERMDVAHAGVAVRHELLDDLIDRADHRLTTVGVVQARVDRGILRQRRADEQRHRDVVVAPSLASERGEALAVRGHLARQEHQRVPTVAVAYGAAQRRSAVAADQDRWVWPLRWLRGDADLRKLVVAAGE